MSETKHKAIVKATPRVLVYGDGKIPGKDPPDEIKQGKERILEYDAKLGAWRDTETGRFSSLEVKNGIDR